MFNALRYKKFHIGLQPLSTTITKIYVQQVQAMHELVLRK